MTAATHDPIDAVITWVDGTAAAHQRSRAGFLAAAGPGLHENAVNPHRWDQSDEIHFCLKSLHRFAPWLRRIWIVVQDAGPDLSAHPSALRGKVQMVRHQDIFGPFLDALPTFNSLAIETMIWRIDGLADRFVYFNDDVFLCAPIAPDDLFCGPDPVLRGRWVDYAGLEGDPSAQADPALFNHFMQINAARLAGFASDHLFAAAHVAHPMCRPVMADLFALHPDAFAQNARHRFRDLGQFLPQGLHNHACLAAGRGVIQDADDHLHIHSGQGADQPVAQTRARLDRAEDPGVKFLCINDLPQLRKLIPDVTTWLDRLVTRG